MDARPPFFLCSRVLKGGPPMSINAMEEPEFTSTNSSMASSRESSPAPSECPHPTALYPLHVKVAWDSSINWSALAQKLFDPAERCLVMAEKLNAATGHVHLQGMCKVSERKLKRIREDLHNEHGLVKEYKRKKMLRPEQFKNKRPPVVSKRAKKEPDDMGFQYICKEKNVPIYQQGFTDLDLDTLYEESCNHVAKLKSTCSTFMADIMGSSLVTIPPCLLASTTRKGQPIPHDEIEQKSRKLYDDCLLRVGQAHIAAGKNINPRFFKTQILNDLVRRPELNEHAQRVLFRMF